MSWIAGAYALVGSDSGMGHIKGVIGFSVWIWRFGYRVRGLVDGVGGGVSVIGGLRKFLRGSCLLPFAGLLLLPGVGGSPVLVFVWGGAQRGGFNFCFSGVFCWYWRGLWFGGGGVGAGLSFYVV